MVAHSSRNFLRNPKQNTTIGGGAVAAWSVVGTGVLWVCCSIVWCSVAWVERRISTIETRKAVWLHSHCGE